MKEIPFEILKSEIESDFIKLSGFVHDLVKTLNREIETSSLIDLKEFKTVEGDRKEFIEFHQHQLNIRFQFHLYSAIIVNYSSLEYNFKKLIDLIKSTHPDLAEHKDSSLSTIEKNLITVRKFLGVNLIYEEIEKDWYDINSYRLLRNLIAHHNGCTLDLSKTKWGNMKGCLEISGVVHHKNGFIYIRDTELIFKFIELSSNFLISILDELKQKMLSESPIGQ